MALPSGRITLIGWSVMRLFLTGKLIVPKLLVAPVSATDGSGSGGTMIGSAGGPIVESKTVSDNVVATFGSNVNGDLFVESTRGFPRPYSPAPGWAGALAAPAPGGTAGAAAAFAAASRLLRRPPRPLRGPLLPRLPFTMMRLFPPIMLVAVAAS